MADSDPLAQLLVDADAVDRQALSTALASRVAIDKKSGRLVPMTGYGKLDAKQKLVATLLARKAARLLRVSDTEAIRTKDLVSLSGLPKGTVAPGLKSLKEAHLVDQDADGSYFVPSALLTKANAFLGAASSGE